MLNKDQIKNLDRETFDNLPDDLLRWFASDCAQRAIERLYKADFHVDPNGPHAPWAARYFVLGTVSIETLNVSQGHLMRFLTMEMQVYTPDDPEYNAYNSARYTCTVSAKDAAYGAAYHGSKSRPLGSGVTEAGERAWQLARLKYLIDVWNICGERAPHLLFDGTCPIHFDPALGAS